MIVSVVKMSTVLPRCTTEEHRCRVRLLWARGPNAKDIHKEMFSVYIGKCVSRKAVYGWVEKRDKSFDDDEEFETR
jgi:hypothetical protein